MNIINPSLIKNVKPLLLITSLLLSQASFASDDKYEAGEKLFKTHCASCHGANVGGMDMNKRIAPPIAAVRLHYIGSYPDETSFVQAISGWLEKQDESKSLMRGAIRKFKIMPPLSIPKDDATKIATYIYAGDIEKPEGFEKHVEEEHGKMGMELMRKKGQGMRSKGMGQGKGMGEGIHRKGQGKGMGMHGQGKGMHKQGRGMFERKQAMMQVMQQKMQNENLYGRQGSLSTKMMQRLNLSPQQQQQMQTLIQEKENTIRPLKMEIRKLNQTISQLDTTASDYKEQIFSLADAKSKLVFRMVIEKGEMRMKIESVLNSEQRAKFKQLRLNRKMKKQNH